MGTSVGTITVGNAADSEVGKIQAATKSAYNSLLVAANVNGINLRTMELEALPDPAAIIRFEQACRAVIDCLRICPHAALKVQGVGDEIASYRCERCGEIFRVHVPS